MLFLLLLLLASLPVLCMPPCRASRRLLPLSLQTLVASRLAWELALGLLMRIMVLEAP